MANSAEDVASESLVCEIASDNLSLIGPSVQMETLFVKET